MLSYFRRGKISSPPLVFLHGFLGDKEDWLEVAKGLENDFCCYCLDLPGHGKSALEDDLLNSLERTLSALQLTNIHLIGYSMGGRLALQLFAKNPSLVDQLILISAHPGLKEESERQKRRQKDEEWAEKLENCSMEDFLKEWYEQEVFAALKKRKELFSFVLDKRKNSNPKNLSAVMRMASLGNQPFFHPPKSSTLLIYGEEDLKFESIYHTLLPSVLKRKIDKCGHAVHLEKPGECANVIRDYLDSKSKMGRSQTI